VVLQNAPRGDVVLVRLYEEVPRENVRSECGGEKGVFGVHTDVRTYVRPGYTHPAAPPPPPPVSPSVFPLFLFSPSRAIALARARFLFLFLFLSLSSPSTPFGLVVRQISRSYGNTMVDDAESAGGC